MTFQTANVHLWIKRRGLKRAQIKIACFTGPVKDTDSHHLAKSRKNPRDTENCRIMDADCRGGIYIWRRRWLVALRHTAPSLIPDALL